MKFVLQRFAWVLAVASMVSIRLPGADLEEEEESGAILPPSIEGAWRWNFVMPDGTTVRPKLTLVLENGLIKGTTSFRPGSETPITNAVLRGNLLSFQVNRERDGQVFSTRYSGQWIRTNITGKIASNWAGETQTFDWEAHRAHLGVEGIWTWTNSIGPRGGRGGSRGGRGGLTTTTRVLLSQDGEKVSGKTLSRLGRPTHISHGSITNNEVSFEIERVFREFKSVSKYQGKQTGDTITGTVEVELDGRTRKGDWEAKRID